MIEDGQAEKNENFDSTGFHFKIHKVEVTSCNSYHNQGTLKVLVEFSVTGMDSDQGDFGMLGRRFGALVNHAPDLDYYGSYPNDFLKELISMEGKKGSVWQPEFASPYELGIMEYVMVNGTEKIQKDENHPEDPNRYFYIEYVVDCLVTRAAIWQLGEMQYEMETGHCKFGNYPNQVGCFRSSNAFHDFLGLLETLDRFWV